MPNDFARESVGLTRGTDAQIPLDKIKGIEATIQVVGLVREIIRPFGIESFVFVSMRRGDISRESYRYLIGCDPAWCLMYQTRNWNNNDPFMEHAASESTMVLGSVITTGTPSQREMLATAAQYGFRSGMVVPAHGAATARVGVLYLGSPLPPDQIEESLWANRMVMRELAFELREWWQAKLHRKALVSLQIDDVDLNLLQHKRGGFTTKEVCELLGLNKAMVDSRLRRLCEKLNAPTTKQAIDKATHLDILAG